MHAMEFRHGLRSAAAELAALKCGQLHTNASRLPHIAPLHPEHTCTHPAGPSSNDSRNATSERNASIEAGPALLGPPPGVYRGLMSVDQEISVASGARELERENMRTCREEGWPMQEGWWEASARPDCSLCKITALASGSASRKELFERRVDDQSWRVQQWRLHRQPGLSCVLVHSLWRFGTADDCPGPSRCPVSHWRLLALLLCRMADANSSDEDLPVLQAGSGKAAPAPAAAAAAAATPIGEQPSTGPQTRQSAAASREGTEEPEGGGEAAGGAAPATRRGRHGGRQSAGQPAPRKQQRIIDTTRPPPATTDIIPWNSPQELVGWVGPRGVCRCLPQPCLPPPWRCRPAPAPAICSCFSPCLPACVAVPLLPQETGDSVVRGGRGRGYGQEGGGVLHSESGGRPGLHPGGLCCNRKILPYNRTAGRRGAQRVAPPTVQLSEFRCKTLTHNTAPCRVLQGKVLSYDPATRKHIVDFPDEEGLVVRGYAVGGCVGGYWSDCLAGSAAGCSSARALRPAVARTTALSEQGAGLPSQRTHPCQTPTNPIGP